MADAERNGETNLDILKTLQFQTILLLINMVRHNMAFRINN